MQLSFIFGLILTRYAFSAYLHSTFGPFVHCNIIIYAVQQSGGCPPPRNLTESPMLIIHALIERARRWYLYRTTIRELSELTDRDLNDLGINRADIEFVARKHAIV